MPVLTKRLVDGSKPRTSEHFIWCSKSPGFGVRIFPTGKKVFICQVRVGRRQQRHKIGLYGPFTVEQARSRADRIVRDVADGIDPRQVKQLEKEALTVSQLLQLYMEASRAGLVTTRFKRPKSLSTISIDEGRIVRHINPLIGYLRVQDVTQATIQRMVDDIGRGKTAGTFPGKSRGRAVVKGGAKTAGRAVELFGGIWTWAARRGHVPPGQNPVRGVEKRRGQPRDRVLDFTELRALGRACRSGETVAPAASAALRLIALTGLRRQEAAGLEWSEIDEPGSCLRLKKSKTGSSVRPIGSAALILLGELPRTHEAFVFPNRLGNAPADFKKQFGELFDAAGFRGQARARSHDLRRTFASVAADFEYSDATIAELLGHARRGVTSRHYIRRPDGALIAAAEKVSSAIAAALQGDASDEVLKDDPASGQKFEVALTS
jgi:integrase